MMPYHNLLRYPFQTHIFISTEALYWKMFGKHKQKYLHLATSFQMIQAKTKFIENLKQLTAREVKIIKQLQSENIFFHSLSCRDLEIFSNSL